MLTVLDLLELELLDVGALGEAKGIERTTGVLPLLWVGLTVTLRLSEGDGNKLHSQDDGKSAPWHWVPQVGGLASGSGSPFLC